MARRKPELPAYVCGDCAHLVPDMEYLSIKERRPILGRCPYSRFMRLLSDNGCENFRQKDSDN